MDIIARVVILASVFLLPDVSCQDRINDFGNDIEDLTSDTDFRSVKLRWRYFSLPEPLGFIVTLCEASRWRRAKNDCFERHLLAGKDSALTGHDFLVSDGRGRFQATLFGLRMLTNYSLSVQPLEDQNRLSSAPEWEGGRRAKLRNPERIFVSTKGFSAYATNCHANTSDIVVHSGPYFGGKVTVEDSSDDRCSIYGNRTSPKDTYTLRIDHKLCGSKTVNGSRIDTIVVVHESSSVVTHNSRRFLVQCTFLPETFTIKAAFNVPQESEDVKRNFNYKQLEEALKNADSNDVFTYEHYKQNSVKDSRMSSEQSQSVLHGNGPGYESQMLGLLIVIIVLIIVIVIVIGFGLWCYIHSHRRRSSSADIETVSTSGSSFMAYQVGDNDALVRPVPEQAIQVPFGDSYGHHSFPRTVNPFLGTQVALVSLKPVKELY